MTEKQMTEAEIMKALECCAERKPCRECPLFNYAQDADKCKNKLFEEAFALINRKNAENEVYKNNLEAMAKTMHNSAKETREEARAAAIKEFAEKAKDTKLKIGNEYMIYADNLDQIAKGMGVEL